MVGHVNDKGITELGVGLISVGWMGKLHSRAFQAIPLVYPELNIRPRLVHAADTAADRAEYAKDVLGYAKGSTDYRDVLADPDVDIVSICAPNLLHKEIGIAAAKAGKPFWIEKPVGRDAVDTGCGRGSRPRGRGRHLDRLQLPARTGSGAHSRSDRGRRAGPDHQRPGGVLQRVRLRAQRCPVLAVQEGPRRQRRARRPAQPRRRPDAVRGRPDHRGERTAVHRFTSSAPSCRWARPPTSRSSRTVSWVRSRTMTTQRLSSGSRRIRPGAGAVGTLEASRVIVGPQCGLGFEVYGTEGSASWNFEQMNELKLAIGRKGPSQGYTTILGNSSQGDYAAFQPGPGNSMGYDDLKVIEAKKFLVAVTGGEQRNSTIDEALADASVISAIAASAVDGQWQKVPQVAGVTFGHKQVARSAGNA